MPRILVLGATGYLGTSVSLNFLRSGLHTVYGLTRSTSGAKTLAKNEIIPVICADPVQDPEPYLSAIRTHRVDVIIDCTAAYGESVKFLHAVKGLSAERLDSFAKEGGEKGGRGPKIGYIYISGAWVHGNSPEAVSDLDAVGTPAAKTKPLELVAWRPEIEREVLTCRDVMDVMVLRPATLYGRASAGWSGLFGPIAEAIKEGKGEVALPLPADARVPVLHVDDVADAVLRGVAVLEGLGCYPVFDLVGSKERLGDVFAAFAKVVGVGVGVGANAGSTIDVQLTAKTAGESGNAWLEAMGSTVNLTSSRAKMLLGWEARRKGLVDGMDVYAKAWEAAL